MTKKIPFILLFLLLGAGSFAQTGRIGEHDAIGKWSATNTTSGFTTSSEGQQIAQQIMDIVGLKPNFKVQAANIPNAAAIVYQGQRYILYNPNFVAQLTKTTGTRWAAVSVLAHEIGHHLDGHTVSSSGSQPRLELEADEFSGFVLRKMGASLAESQAAMRTIAQQRASATHPAQYDRLASIEKGWEKADDQLAGRPSRNTDVASTTVRQPERVAQNYPVAQAPARRSGNVIGEVRFNADPSSAYYITNALNLVKVGYNNQASVIGKLARLNNRQYPYMIYDESNTQLLVDTRGNILNQRGRAVGVMSGR
jgi:hypothetical protein